MIRHRVQILAECIAAAGWAQEKFTNCKNILDSLHSKDFEPGSSVCTQLSGARLWQNEIENPAIVGRIASRRWKLAILKACSQAQCGVSPLGLPPPFWAASCRKLPLIWVCGLTG